MSQTSSIRFKSGKQKFIQRLSNAAHFKVRKTSATRTNRIYLLAFPPNHQPQSMPAMSLTPMIATEKAHQTRSESLLNRPENTAINHLTTASLSRIWSSLPKKSVSILVLVQVAYLGRRTSHLRIVLCGGRIRNSTKMSLRSHPGQMNNDFKLLLKNSKLRNSSFCLCVCVYY